MSRRIPLMVGLVLLLLFSAACTNKKINNPLANVGSKQPDKVLFDRAMEQLKHNRFDQGRMILQTLINTYPDSEYIARAKLAVGDSWYGEGGTTALAQAELEYRDFITFFPNMPEAAEAQLKIANIHYQQMEKPDRDFTHAMRAEDEYRQLIMQFPDSKLVPEAKQRLLEVQEVLAEREFLIGRFYYLRPSYAAAIARLQSVVDRYPLFSGADEALYLLGQSYEAQIATIRASKMPEAAKAKMIEELTKSAAKAYSNILTRYPVMDRADDARKRLQALHQPVPNATKEAIAQNEKEEDSRRGQGLFGHLMGGFTRHPDVAQATKVGEPPLVDPKPVSAKDIVDAESRSLMSGGAPDNKLAGEIVKTGTPPPNQEAPRSDSPAPVDNSAGTPPATGSASVEVLPNNNNSTTPPPESKDSSFSELKPNVSEDSSQTPPPPPQVNEIQQGTPGQPADATSGSKPADSASSGKQKEDDKTVSSSKKHRKKRKLLLF